MNITIIGTGYVGVVTAVVFADFGNQVWGLDVDPNRIEQLKQGIPPIHEPRLEEFLKRGLETKRLAFTTDYTQALEDTDAIFVCVGTPQAVSGEVDLTYVESAATSIAQHLKKPAIIVLKSTVPPGVHHRLKAIIDQHVSCEYEFASVPEFLREGSAVSDTLHPSRVVIGVQSQKAEEVLLNLHKPLSGERVITDIISAQMIKYAANGFLATKISFANAIARICDQVGADVSDVMKGIGLDPRIGSSFLYPGLGFGGSCFPKDIQGLYHLSKQAGYDFELMQVVSNINHDQVAYVLDQASKKIDTFQGKKVGVLGLAFKPDTDDMREARSLVLITELKEKGAEIIAYDPVAIEVTQKLLGDTISYAKTAYEAVEGVDVVFVVTEWNEFKEIDLEKVKKLMKGNLLVDGRNMYDPEQVKKLGFEYVGVGRR